MSDTQQGVKIALPEAVISPADVSRLRRGAGDLADYLNQMAIKNGDEPLPKPRTGLLADFGAANDLDLSHVEDCRQAVNKLSQLQKLAPVVHISFAAEPSDAFMRKIAAWFRANINPLTLITVGLQPSVAAGCYLRTTNRYFDLSLRKHLIDSRGQLVERLEALKKL